MRVSVQWFRFGGRIQSTQKSITYTPHQRCVGIRHCKYLRQCLVSCSISARFSRPDEQAEDVNDQRGNWNGL